MPSLIDMSQHSGNVGMEPGDGMNQLRGDQTLNYDQRSVNFDQRSVSVEHHTHGVNPELLTNMTVAAASAELRAQATQEVAGLREATISASTSHDVGGRCRSPAPTAFVGVIPKGKPTSEGTISGSLGSGSERAIT